MSILNHSSTKSSNTTSAIGRLRGTYVSPRVYSSVLTEDQSCARVQISIE